MGFIVHDISSPKGILSTKLQAKNSLQNTPEKKTANLVDADFFSHQIFGQCPVDIFSLFRVSGGNEWIPFISTYLNVLLLEYGAALIVTTILQLAWLTLGIIGRYWDVPKYHVSHGSVRFQDGHCLKWVPHEFAMPGGAPRHTIPTSYLRQTTTVEPRPAQRLCGHRSLC